MTHFSGTLLLKKLFPTFKRLCSKNKKQHLLAPHAEKLMLLQMATLMPLHRPHRLLKTRLLMYTA